MAPSVPLLYILFTVGFLTTFSISISQIELGVQFLEEPKDVIGVKGKSLTLHCRPARASRQEFFEIKWYHNNRLMDLTKDKRRTIFPNGTLHFSKLVHKRSGHSDQGEYRCVIAKANGSLSSRPAFLRISVLPKGFSRHPVKQTVKMGGNIRLSCEIESFSELKIEWGKDDQKLPQNDLKYLTVSGPGVHGSILYIFNAVPDDSGSYRCIAKNILLNKERLSSNGLVTVLPRGGESNLNQNSLTFFSAQRSLSSSFFASVKEIKEGDNVTLDCVVNGSSTPVLVWNFQPHDQTTRRPVFNQTNSGYNIQKINNITRHQAGWYTCTAVNSTKIETTTEIQVLTLPEIIEKSENIAFRASKTVRFRCVASGNPLPGIYWLKDGNLFNITGRIKHRTSVNESQQLRLSELILSSTVTSDAGIYQCMANNSVGSAWAASRLLLNASRPAPRPPEKVFCETISSSQIKLTWDVPTATNKIIAFSVHYHLTDNGEEEQKVLASNSRFTQIDKLQPFTNYTFYVRLYIDSASEFSRKTVCQTGEEVPLEAPKMKLLMVSPNSVHLSWLPLASDKARGVVNKYKIQWRIKGSPSSRVEVVSSDVTDYTIPGLIPGKNYEVRVLAATSKGWPDEDFPWESLEIPLNYSHNLPSAPEVRLQAINSSSIGIKWSVPIRGTEVKGFKIFYRKHNGNQLGPVVTPSAAKEYVITGLDPETWYEVMVLGFTDADDGEMGVNSIHTLSKDGSWKKSPVDPSSILEPPAFLEADPISPVAINLTWSSPQVSSGSNRLKYYTVCFNLVQTSRNKETTPTCLKSLDNRLLIVGLNPFTLYEFKVKSHDHGNQQSAFSQAVECHTLEDVPSAVVDVSWKALNRTTVQVTWKKPKLSNGIIRNYTLFYTKNSDSPLSSWAVKVVPSTNFKTQLTDLTSNVKYYLLVRASTGAGLGSYGSPKEFLIPSPTDASREESAPKTSKDKQGDQYIGIMVGLGIGLCCIILCTTCILCRRRCLKRHISQEFEVTYARYTNGSDCRRDREIVREPREAEYFTFLSAQRDRHDSMEVSLQNSNSKDLCPNGSANGIKKSLLNEGRTTNITENPRFQFDPNCSQLPLLTRGTHYDVLEFGSESPESFQFFNNCRNSSRSVRSGKRKPSEVKVPGTLLNNNNFEPENRENGGKIVDKVPRLISHSHGDSIVRDSIEVNEANKSNESESWLNLNSVLQNPEFRFSDSKSEKVIKAKNGFTLKGHFQNSISGQNTTREKNSAKVNDDYLTQPVNGIFPKQMLSKEITLES